MAVSASGSPSVQVKEFDLTTVITSVATSAAGQAGVFRWGPVNQLVQVSAEPDVVAAFGKPTSLNPETFFNAANFLSYSSNMYLVRVGDTALSNAALNIATSYANTGAVSTVPLVLNYAQYQVPGFTFDANVDFCARYPGSLGNDLRISQCDSAAAFSSNVTFTGNTLTNAVTVTIGANVAQIAVTANVAGVANASANTFLGKFAVGDYLVLGNTSIGTQSIKISSIGTPAEVSNGGNYVATANINLYTPYNLGTTYVANTISRNWEFSSFFSVPPGQSPYVAGLNLTTQDQLHVVVCDNNGLFTGTPGSILETWQGLSRATDSKNIDNTTNYYKTVINAGSNYLYVGADRSGAASGLANAISNSTTTTAWTFNLANGQDGTDETAVSLAALTAGYDLFRSKEDVAVSVLCQGKARGTSADSLSNPSSSTYNYSVLANYIIGNISEKRNDVMTVISPAKVDVLQGDPTTNVVAFRNNVNIASSYGVMDSGYKYQYDKYNDTSWYVPLNGDIAGLMARTDYTNDPWWSPAGYNRGQINNVVKLAWNPKKAQRDTLYNNQINPVVTTQGSGTVLFGDKTLLGNDGSAFSRINVRRLFIVLEASISLAAQNFLFEFNDYLTRNQFVNMVTPFLRDVQGRRGIYDFSVICDETNNTAQVIDNEQFVGTIAIKPARAINWVILNFVAVGDSVTFSQVIGSI